jgi:hypothetical protein
MPYVAPRVQTLTERELLSVPFDAWADSGWGGSGGCSCQCQGQCLCQCQGQKKT